MQSEDQRSEGIASEDDSDLECEEEEVATQSDGGLAERNAGDRALGRKRMYSETVTEQVSLSSPDAKCRQASNLHNERERERRKDLKQAVHRLRNQLQLRKTKKATTISVLKASEQEIKDLLLKKAEQERELGDLQNHHKYLTWKLESLRTEGHKDSRPVASNPTPVLSPLLPTPPPPPLTSMAPMFYMPPTPSATHSPLPLCPRQATIPPSPSPFPFGVLLQPSPLLSPAPPFPMAAHPQPLSVPPSRPIFVPRTFTFPPFLPRLPSAGQFGVPTAAGTFPHSHLLSPSFPALMLPPITNPLTATSPFLTFPTHSADVPPTTSSAFGDQTTSGPVSTAPQPSPSTSPFLTEDGGNSPLLSRHSVQSLEASDSPHSSEARYPSSSQREQGHRKSSSRYCSSSECEDDNIDGSSDHLIDVESTDQEGGSLQQVCNQRSFLDIQHCQYQQQSSPGKQETNRAASAFSYEQKRYISPTSEAVGSKNLQSPPADVKQVGGIRNIEVSRSLEFVEPTAKVLTKDLFTSDIHQHSLFFDSTDVQYTTSKSFKSWKGVSCTKQRAKQLDQIITTPSPSIIDLNPIHHPPPVFCS